MRRAAACLLFVLVLTPDPAAAAPPQAATAPSPESNWTTLSFSATDLLGVVMPADAIVSVSREAEAIKIELALAAAARLQVTMLPPSGAASLRFLDASGAPVPIGNLEQLQLQQVRSAIAAEPRVMASPVAAPLVRLLDWIAEAPPGYVLDLRFENARLKSLCSKIGRAVTARWDFTGGADSTSATLGPCGEGRCFGRCGQGCGGDPGPEAVFQQFTQDCLNHDACVASLGYAAAGCQDEFSATADDVLYAPDCNAVEGDWQIVYATNPSALNRMLSFTMTGETFVGTALVAEGRYSTIQGARAAAPALTATTVKIPLWMPASCDSEFLGFAIAKLKGTNYCGKIRARLVKGRWPGLNTSTCESGKIFPWTGQLTARRTRW